MPHLIGSGLASLLKYMTFWFGYCLRQAENGLCVKGSKAYLPSGWRIVKFGLLCSITTPEECGALLTVSLVLSTNPNFY